MLKYLWLALAVIVFCVVSYFIKVPSAQSQDIYGSILPSTVTRSSIGFSSNGAFLQLNPIARNVRPYDTLPVPTYLPQGQGVTTGKKKGKHPRPIICFHFSVKIH